MTIFKTYTGNAMLNNALMIIKALGAFENLSQIGGFDILELYNKLDLVKMNKRFKSYTMLFTNNGPLLNDKTNGDKIFHGLFNMICSNIEQEGTNVCEVSGIRFDKSFKEFYTDVLKNLGASEKEIAKKDLNISRVWWPLLGSFGSDAQALPQAKHSFNIHPVCILCLQFLPFGSFLYNGGILLIDSSNFSFAEEFIRNNVKEISRRIETKSNSDIIENFKDKNKGSYLLNAMEILDKKEDDFEDNYSELNLWSFSNSGTGANCTIDRIPSSLLKKMLALKRYNKTSSTLSDILNGNYFTQFIEALDDNREWYGLYKTKFGTGKKTVDYPGVDESFFEMYFKLINEDKKLAISKYVASLIKLYGSKDLEKLIIKSDGYKDPAYRMEVLLVLYQAAKDKKWDIGLHFYILDYQNDLPVKNYFSGISRMVHFYCQFENLKVDMPATLLNECVVKSALLLVIRLIESDSISSKIISNLLSNKDNNFVKFTEILNRRAEKGDFSEQEFGTYISIFYTSNFALNKNHLLELLKLYFLNPITLTDLETNWEVADELFIKHYHQIFAFAKNYIEYFLNKYPNSYAKLEKSVAAFPNEHTKYKIFMEEVLENTNRFNKDRSLKEWGEEIFYNPIGEFSLSYSKLILKQILFNQIRHLKK